MPDKKHAKWVLLAFGATAGILLVTALTPFAIPCVFRLVAGIPCPACGLSRAFLYVLRLDFFAALRMNILLLPLIIGGTVYLVCALLELRGKPAIARLNAVLSKKWIIALAAVLAAASWAYNIIYGI